MAIASVVVMFITVFMSMYYQKNAELKQIQHQGALLSKLFAGMSFDQLVKQDGSRNTLKMLMDAQSIRHIAYVVVADTDGDSLADVTAPGVAVPKMNASHQPSEWFDDHEYLDKNGHTIYEYHAPVMQQGELHGFIRLGYTEPGYLPSASGVTYLAMPALAVAVLMVVLYLLVRSEFKPLGNLIGQIQQLISKTETADADPVAGDSVQQLVNKLSTAITAVGSYIETLEAKQTNSVVSCKLLIYQRARMESALNSLPYAVMVADETGQVTYASSKVHRLLAINEGELLGCHLADISANRELSEFLVSCQMGNSVTVCHHDEIDIYLSETDKYVSVNSYPLYSQKNNKQLLGTVVLFQDTVDDSANQKGSSEFIAHVAHELKTPLNVLSMYSELLLNNADSSRDLTINAANVIHDETGRIAEMIDNLLNLTMIEMGTVAINRQRIKVGEFLEDIYQTMSRNELLATMDFRLDVPQDLGVLSLDKSLIRVAINNLVGNAIKYNRPGGKIELTAEENETEIVIRVRDTGIGISEEDQHLVFNKFFRSEDDETRKRSGHGLGLSLVREIVALHQGKIQLNSTRGEGSEFVLSFAKDSIMLKDVI